MVKEIKEGRSYNFSFNNNDEKLYLIVRCPPLAWFINDTFKVEIVYQTLSEETLFIRVEKRAAIIVPTLIMKYMNIVQEYIQEQMDV